jgi:hypothetical protein
MDLYRGSLFWRKIFKIHILSLNSDQQFYCVFRYSWERLVLFHSISTYIYIQFTQDI